LAAIDTASKIRVYNIKENLLWVAMIAISFSLFRAAVSTSKVLPVGGLIAGTFKVPAIDKCLQQQESFIEMVQPIRGQPRNI